MENSNRHKGVQLWAKTGKQRKSSQHVRECAAGDGGICSKNIKKLSHIMGPTPILEMVRAYGLRPRLYMAPALG